MIQAPGSDEIQLFGVDLLVPICKLDHLMAQQKIEYNNEMVQLTQNMTLKQLYNINSRLKASRPDLLLM
jgi:hypothetical protein